MKMNNMNNMHLLRELLNFTINKNGFNILSLEEFYDQTINETFLGNHKKLPPDKFELHLKNIRNDNVDPKRRKQMPIIHKSIIGVVDENNNLIDMDALRRSITTRPPIMLQKNNKMQHSEGKDAIYFNIGLPALRGLAVDENTNEFIIVNTCPHAGSCLIDCYALKGGYVQYPKSSRFRSRMINFLVNDPDGFKTKLMQEIGIKLKTAKRKNKQLAIRWHDAGDFFSMDYLKIANEIANAFPDVNFYAYTKNSSVMGNTPPNFDPRFSDGATPEDMKKIDFKVHRSGRIVPKELFVDLRDGEKKNPDGRWKFKSNTIPELKERIAKYYDVDVNTILTDQEYMERSKRLGKTENKWNVIIIPGGSDAPASDKRVLNVFNLFHD